MTKPGLLPMDASTARAVQRAKSLLQQFIDELPGTVFMKGRDRRLLMVNRPMAAQLGLTPREMVGKTVQDLFPPEFADQLDQMDDEAFASGERRTVDEHYAGRHFETRLFVMGRVPNQQILAGLSLDVTERYEASQLTSVLLQINDIGSVVPERELLNRTLEMAQSLTGSEIGFLHFVNPDQQTLELVTWTAGALQTCTAAYDAHYPVDKAGIWADCVREQRAVVFNDYPAYAAKRGLPEGHTPLQRLISVPVLEGGGVRLIIGVGNRPSAYSEHHVEALSLIGGEVWRIVRRLRAEAALAQRVDELTQVNHKLAQAQAQLLQAEKMASIGQLAAGVAHEINNPIGFVKSNLGSLSRYVADLMALLDDYQALEASADAASVARVRDRKAEIDWPFLAQDLPQLLAESRDGVERVSKIVQDLKSFSRAGSIEWGWSDLLGGLESTLNMVWNQIKYKADVVRELQALPSVYCVASQINQVFMNLLVNAAQAIEPGEQRGRITLRSGLAPGRVWVEVEDTGCGMAPELLARIFEPFYTTKPVGVGTGLGLPIAAGIAQRHGGQIEAFSQPGQGTRMRLSLPIQGPAQGQPPIKGQP